MTEKKDNKRLNRTETILLDSLRRFLEGAECGTGQSCPVDREVVMLANTHSVLPFLYQEISANREQIDAQVYDLVQSKIGQTINQSYHLFFETYRIVQALEEAGIMVTVLKGVAVASFYPVFEYRKSGDIDVLINDTGQTEEAEAVLKKLGYLVSARQEALHQIVMVDHRGITVELHVMLSEPFDNTKINDILESVFEDIKGHRIYKEILGFPIPILDDDYQAFELLIHMLQHFLRRGFGIRLLCDWVVYWNGYIAKEKKPADRYQELISRCGIAGFSDMVSAVCFYYLGLSEEAYDVLTEQKRSRRLKRENTEEFLIDILEGGEFGDEDPGRMVVLRSASFRAYVIEFHHQMRLNFPKAGRCPVLWPALWIATLHKFLKNNRKVRRMSSRVFFEKAESRSRLVKKMKLWEKE